MPINFYLASGQKEQITLTQSVVGHTVVQWHPENLRFVVIELQPKLYGIDLSAYAQSISLQLKQAIPVFDQLLNWCNKIDPRAVSAKILVGQICAETNRLELQAFDKQFVWLLRFQNKYKIEVTPKGIIGELLPGDQLIIGSSKLIANLDKNVLLDKPIKNQLENLSHRMQQETKLLLVTNILEQKINLKKLIKSFQIQRKTQINSNYIFPTPTFSLKRGGFNFQNKHKISLLIACIFLIALIISVGLGINKRNYAIEQQKQQQLIADVTYRLEQAKSLQELNPARAKTLLTEASQSLDDYIANNKLPSPTLEELKHNVSKAYELVSGLILVQEASLFYDPNLLKDGFSPLQLSLSDDDLVLLDTKNKIAGNVNLDSKSAEIIAGSNQIQDSTKLASIPAWVFLLSANRLAIIDKNTQKQIKSFVLANTNVSDMVGYGNNLYILDVASGQVYRFRGVHDGLAKAEDYFDKKQDLTGAVKLAVDGSLWLLYSNGSIEKYTSGLRDALYSDFNLDEPLKSSSSFFTDENQNNIYILDKLQNRIVAVSKIGEFKAEYHWQGLSSCDGFVVSEKIGKILVLKDGKIWGINLK